MVFVAAWRWDLTSRATAKKSLSTYVATVRSIILNLKSWLTRSRCLHESVNTLYSFSCNDFQSISHQVNFRFPHQYPSMSTIRHSSPPYTLVKRATNQPIFHFCIAERTGCSDTYLFYKERAMNRKAAVSFYNLYYINTLILLK